MLLYLFYQFDLLTFFYQYHLGLLLMLVKFLIFSVGHMSLYKSKRFLPLTFNLSGISLVFILYSNQSLILSKDDDILSPVCLLPHTARGLRYLAFVSKLQVLLHFDRCYLHTIFTFVSKTGYTHFYFLQIQLQLLYLFGKIKM